MPQFLQAVQELQAAVLPPLVTLGHTLEQWAEEIGRTWRFSRNNGITEGFGSTTWVPYASIARNSSEPDFCPAWTAVNGRND